MSEVRNVKHIGMQRAHALANLSARKQLDLIAEGLPILMQSASSLLEASNQLTAHPRSAAILRRHADEEVAKVLILIDLVRCPAPQRASRVGKMTKWFYSHLARLIYVESQYWKPTNVKELQSYINTTRHTHYLEGGVGEYIMPNWEIYCRESDLYADIEADEYGILFWNDPQSRFRERDFKILPNDSHDPLAWRVCKALQNLGVFTRQGLDLASKAWSSVNFQEIEHHEDAKCLTHKMVCALEEARLISDDADDSQLGTLYHQWQLPMYHMDFSPIEITLKELQEERDNNLWHEMGY